VRVLAVAGTPPWPETGGARRRLATILRGLSRVGDIDLLLLLEPGTTVSGWPSDAVPVRRTLVLPRPPGRFRGWYRLWWLLAGRKPAGLAGRDYAGTRRQARAWCAPDYDVVWFGRLESYLALQRTADGPAIVDFDDLEDRVIRGRLALEREATARPRHRLGRRLRLYAGERDARLWALHQAAVAREVAAVTVCSETDRQRLGVGNCHVIPNGYPVPERPAGRSTVGSPPVVLFHGTLTHPPNVDAARFLVERVAPRLRARMPAVRLRLAGRCDDRVGRLHAPPQVVVSGFVDDMTQELARADLVAVPVRYGSGTRVKILEAFAHGIPVVSTTLGAEGLGVRHGHELLVADQPEAFADACWHVLTDAALRRRLVENARAAFLARFRSEHVEDLVARLALTVVGFRKGGAPV
jgi:glycosyltransferase involved in cell wall biosynthesis